MLRMLISASTGVAGLLLAAAMPQDPPERPQPPDAPLPPGITKMIEVKTARSTPAEEAAEAMEQAYDLLVKLRVEGLEGKPKEMLEKAVVLYREAVAAYDTEKATQVRKSRSRARAALELARAIDRLEDVRRRDNPDTDLPAPPTRNQMKWRSEENQEIAVIRIPPVVEGKPLAGVKPPNNVRFFGGDEAKFQVRVEMDDEGKKGEGEDRQVFVIQPDDLGGLARVEVRVNERRLQDLAGQLQEQAARFRSRLRLLRRI